MALSERKKRLAEAVARRPHGVRDYVCMDRAGRRAFVDGAKALQTPREIDDYVARSIGTSGQEGAYDADGAGI